MIRGMRDAGSRDVLPGTAAGGCCRPGAIRAPWVRIFLLASVLGACAPDGRERPAHPPDAAGAESASEDRSGTALIITGAAARIPQEAALLQTLDGRGLLSDVVFISGVSSGALNAVALNGILSGRLSWDRYREILFALRSEDVFVRRGRRLPVDTAPARALFRRIAEDELGYLKIGDLPIATAITVTRLRDLGLEQTAYRLCSVPINPESDPGLGLASILAATTAIPVVFPPARIPGVRTIPDIEYVDGGASEDYVPFESLLEFERYRGKGVDRVIIVTRKFDQGADVSEELSLLGVDDHRVLDYLGVSFDHIADRKLRKSLGEFARKAPETAERTILWIPDFPEKYLLLDFDSLEDQYLRTLAWAAGRSPVSLAEYLWKRPAFFASEP